MDPRSEGVGSGTHCRREPTGRSYILKCTTFTSRRERTFDKEEVKMVLSFYRDDKNDSGFGVWTCLWD